MISNRRTAVLVALTMAGIVGVVAAPLTHADDSSTASVTTNAVETELDVSADDNDVELTDDEDATDAGSDAIAAAGGTTDGDKDDDGDKDYDDDKDGSSTSSTSSSTTSTTTAPTTTAAPTTTVAPATTLAPTTTVAPSGELPATGGDSSLMTTLAGLGLAAGTAITLASRRRHAS